MVFLRTFTTQGVIAVFDEIGTSGSAIDYNAARNAPAKEPTAHLDKVMFHSDFDYYELFSGPNTVNVSHAALAGFTSTDLGVQDIPIFVYGQDSSTDFVLTTHNLGYKPRYFVAFNGAMLTNGTVVQTESDGRARFVTVFATTTQIILRDFATSSDQALTAVSKSYEIMVFKEPQPDPTKPLLKFDGSVLQIGRGRIESDKKYLRKVLAGESSFDVDLGVTMDVSGGRIRVVSGGNVYSESGYTGAFVGPSFQPVSGVS